MYTVVGTSKSRAARVLWLLEELGQPYTQIPAAPQSAEARAHNPAGKVPTLVDGSDVITDSTAILTYLADKHGAFTATAGTPARAQQDSLTQCLLDEFDALLWTSARHSFVLPEDMRLPAIKESLRWEYARNLARLDARLKGPYLMGDEMTVPDVIATHCLSWGLGAKFAAPEGDLADYLARMRERPAFLRAMAR
jgi:glutathione S-transferase